jgi:putative aminopeptidase FrvX
MHSPAEVCDLGDLAAAIELVTALVAGLRPDDDWTR